MNGAKIKRVQIRPLDENSSKTSGKDPLGGGYYVYAPDKEDT